MTFIPDESVQNGSEVPINRHFEDLKQGADLQFLNFNAISGEKPDLICFSHLRWDFVFQRPQHLITRFAKQIRVFFIEEPIWESADTEAWMEVSARSEKLSIAVPHLPGGLDGASTEQIQKQLLDQLIAEKGITSFVSWYYTPMALGFSSHLSPAITVYDCMDELSAFRGAPPALLEREKELFAKADLVFTGGQSLYEAKKERHPKVFAFPSSIERDHFAQARMPLAEPKDQENIPHPRFGFYGVIDERFDLELLGGIAVVRPDWHLIILGPVVKIDPATLPQASNIHYLGMKSYEELPSYLSGWDVALLLFAMNESTRFISPTKTPEYLAAGRPVVSTPIRDVVRPYGEKALVHIASDTETFVKAIEQALLDTQNPHWLERVDSFLSENSWDQTWARMTHLICKEWTEKIK